MLVSVCMYVCVCMCIYVIVYMCVWVYVRTGQYRGLCVCVTDQISTLKFQLIFSSNYPHHSSLLSSSSSCLSLSYCFSLPHHLTLLFLPSPIIPLWSVIIFFKLILKYFNFSIFHYFVFSFSTVLLHRSITNDMIIFFSSSWFT